MKRVMFCSKADIFELCTCTTYDMERKHGCVLLALHYNAGYKAVTKN